MNCCSIIKKEIDFNDRTIYFIEFVPILEGRSVVCLQMSDTAAALKDINQAIKFKRSAELHVNRGVIYQVNLKSNNFKKIKIINY